MSNRAVVAAFTFALAGCSLIGVKGPRGKEASGTVRECTDSYLLPGVDLVLATAFIVVATTGVLAEDCSDGSCYPYEAVDYGKVLIVPGVINLTSGLFGLATVHSCREAIARGEPLRPTGGIFDPLPRVPEDGLVNQNSNAVPRPAPRPPW